MSMHTVLDKISQFCLKTGHVKIQLMVTSKVRETMLHQQRPWLQGVTAWHWAQFQPPAPRGQLCITDNQSHLLEGGSNHDKDSGIRAYHFFTESLLLVKSWIKWSSSKWLTASAGGSLEGNTEGFGIFESFCAVVYWSPSSRSLLSCRRAAHADHPSGQPLHCLSSVLWNGLLTGLALWAHISMSQLLSFLEKKTFKASWKCQPCACGRSKGDNIWGLETTSRLNPRWERSFVICVLYTLLGRRRGLL